MLEQIRKISKERYQKDDFTFHISVVVKNAMNLAEVLRADKEIVEIAALLHDIGRTKGFKPSDNNEHHLAGAKVAEQILKDLHYPEKRTKKVVGCILAHRGSKDDYIPQTMEEKIVANADAMAHFDSFLDLFKEFVQKEDLPTAVKLISDKIERDWNKKLTLPEAKKIMEPKYHAIRLILDSMIEVIGN